MALEGAGGGTSPAYVAGDERDAALGGGKFMVDPEQVPALVRGLEDVQLQLRSIRSKLEDVATIAPPGEDPYSAQAVSGFGEVVQGGAMALTEAHDKFVKSVSDTIANIQSMQSSTSAQDDATGSSFNGGS